jgi:hypothetical protein
MTDLSLVLREELYLELCKRYDGVVLITFKHMENEILKVMSESMKHKEA